MLVDGVEALRVLEEAAEVDALFIGGTGHYTPAGNAFIARLAKEGLDRALVRRAAREAAADG